MEKNFFLKKKERSIVDQSFFFLSLFLFLFVPFFSFLSLSLPNFLKKKKKRKRHKRSPRKKNRKKSKKSKNQKKTSVKNRVLPSFTEFSVCRCVTEFLLGFSINDSSWTEFYRVLLGFLFEKVFKSYLVLPSFFLSNLHRVESSWTDLSQVLAIFTAFTEFFSGFLLDCT